MVNKTLRVASSTKFFWQCIRVDRLFAAIGYVAGPLWRPHSAGSCRLTTLASTTATFCQLEHDNRLTLRASVVQW